MDTEHTDTDIQGCWGARQMLSMWHWDAPEREKKKESVSHSVTRHSLWYHGLYPARLLCPRDFLGKKTTVSCHSLLQGIFLTQGMNPGLLHCRQILYLLSHQGSPALLHITHLENRLPPALPSQPPGFHVKWESSIRYTAWWPFLQTALAFCQFFYLTVSLIYRIFLSFFFSFYSNQLWPT